MFTGGFENMSRSEAKSIAESKGGKVLVAISKKLDYFQKMRMMNGTCPLRFQILMGVGFHLVKI